METQKFYVVPVRVHMTYVVFVPASDAEEAKRQALSEDDLEIIAFYEPQIDMYLDGDVRQLITEDGEE